MNYIKFDLNGYIVDKNIQGIVATSNDADVIHIFYANDTSTEETAYRTRTRVKRADGHTIGPTLLTLSTASFDTQAEAETFGLAVYNAETEKWDVACRKLSLTAEMLGVKGDIGISIIYDQVNEQGAVLSTDVNQMIVAKVYEAVDELLTEEEFNQLVEFFLPRDLGDLTDGNKPDLTQKIVIRQGGATKLITLDQLNSLLEDGVTEFKKVKYDVNSPAATLEIGETRWNDVAGTLETRLSTDVYLLHSQEALFKCQNISGKDIANGTAVYISGASGGSPNFYVDKADNTNLTKASRMIGLTTEEINDNSSGYVCFSGIVNGVNTASFNVGDMLYLSTGGTLTNVRPTGLVVEVGIVIRKHSNNGAVAINPRYYPRLDDLSNVNFTDSAEGDVAIRLANGTYANYNLTSKLGEIDAKDLEQDGRLDDVESDITNLETYSATKAELTTHNEDATAHLPIRQEIEVIRQDVSRIEGRVKSYGEINYTQSELMALNEGARNTAIYDDILARFEDYTLANGDAVYTKASATDNDHEWEYNGNTWVDNGAYILQKASNTLFGVVKGGNVYTNIINGLIEVILSDYATKVGDSTNSYTYQQLKTILDTYASDIADRYTKSEVYNKTEIDNMGFSTNDYTNEDKQNVEKIPTIEQYIVDLVNDKVSKTSIVDNLTTNDATKVLSAKQGKALQDTKEALANKATNFSVVNDIKYPTTKAVQDLVDATVGNIDAILDSILGV